MPRFFFNVRYRPGLSGLAEDQDGDELTSVEEARTHALSMARDLIAGEPFAIIDDWMDCSFEVVDEAGHLLLMVPFSDAMLEPARHNPG